MELDLKSVLLVVNGYAAAHDLRRAMPEGWTVVAFGAALAGQRFDLILLPAFHDAVPCFTPRDIDAKDERLASTCQWVVLLETKLTVGGKIVRI